MLVKIVNKSSNALPQYETGGSVGMDIRSNDSVTIASGKTALIKTGLFVEIPYGYEIQVRPRSGLALKHSVTVLNSPGTIDSDYRGEVGVILINHGTEDFQVKIGERIAQLVLAKVEHIAWQAVGSLNGGTKRGEKGFGSTGK
jgi:dUTP pyrophosphatase